MSDGPTLLVLGAQSGGSLGDYVAETGRSAGFGRVATAGINDEEFVVDARNSNQLKDLYDAVRPDYVVCTIGINIPKPGHDVYLRTVMMDSFETNVVAPMEALRLFRQAPRQEGHDERWLRKFVVVSSNSARIPRRGSAPYCASKAALSMALRVVARETAQTQENLQVWGYEPGLLAGTPMTEEILRHFGDPNNGLGVPPLHRMPGVGPQGLPPAFLALKIVDDLAHSSAAMHGLLFPFDAGEL